MLYVLCGKSCSGKDAIKKELLKKTKLESITTYTTRPKRRGEKDGVTYHFVDSDEMVEMIEEGKFAEYKTYNVTNGDIWYYGCSITDIERAEDEDYIIILTPEGVRDIQRTTSIPMKVFYIYANQRTIKARLLNRGSSKEENRRRMEQDDIDFKDAEILADKIVYNNLDSALDEVVDKIISLM